MSKPSQNKPTSGFGQASFASHSLTLGSLTLGKARCLSFLNQKVSPPASWSQRRCRVTPSHSVFARSSASDLIMISLVLIVSRSYSLLPLVLLLLLKTRGNLSRTLLHFIPVRFFFSSSCGLSLLLDIGAPVWIRTSVAQTFPLMPSVASTSLSPAERSNVRSWVRGI